MKLKMVQPGYEQYTGYFGQVYFENGVSVEEVSDKNAQQLAALISFVDAETGESVSMLHAHAEARYAEAGITYLKSNADLEAEKNGGEVVEAAPQASNEFVIYTREQLEDIADKKGIAGLREIADARNIKGTSVAKLIDQIIASQTPVEKAQ